MLAFLDHHCHSHGHHVRLCLDLKINHDISLSVGKKNGCKQRNIYNDKDPGIHNLYQLRRLLVPYAVRCLHAIEMGDSVDYTL